MKVDWHTLIKEVFPAEREFPDGVTLCKRCHGAGYENSGDYISVCRACGGKGTEDKWCAECKEKLPPERRQYIYCSTCQGKRDKEKEMAEKEKDTALFEKAEAVSWKGFDGYVMSREDDERVVDIDEYLEQRQEAGGTEGEDDRKRRLRGHGILSRSY